MHNKIVEQVAALYNLKYTVLLRTCAFVEEELLHAMHESGKESVVFSPLPMTERVYNATRLCFFSYPCFAFEAMQGKQIGDLKSGWFRPAEAISLTTVVNMPHFGATYDEYDRISQTSTMTKGD